MGGKEGEDVGMDMFTFFFRMFLYPLFSSFLTGFPDRGMPGHSYLEAFFFLVTPSFFFTNVIHSTRARTAILDEVGARSWFGCGGGSFLG